MKKYILSWLSFMICFTGMAQPTPGIQWQRAFGGQGPEQSTIVRKTNDGGFIMASTSDSASTAITGGHAGKDIWVIKMSATGVVQWSKAYGGSGDDFLREIFLNTDGSYTLFSQTYSNNGDVNGNHGQSDIWGFKISATGALLWQRCYGGSLVEEYRGGLVNNTGNIVLSIVSTSNNGDVTGGHSISFTDFWIVEINNSTGAIIAQKAYGGTSNDTPRGIIQLSDGKYVVTGFTMSNDGDVSGNHSIPADTDIWLLKLSSITTMEWQKCLGSPVSGRETGFKVAESAGRSILLMGEVVGNGGDVSGFKGVWDSWMAKVSETGTFLWQKCLGGSGADWPINFFENNDGSIFVLNNTVSNDGDVTGFHNGGSGTEDLWMVKLSNTGNLLWQRTYGGSEGDGAYRGQRSFILQPDSNFVIAGFTNSNDGDVLGYHPRSSNPLDTAADIWVLKVSKTNGAIMWQRCLGGSWVDYLTSIEQTSPTDFIIGAETLSTNGDVSGPRQTNNPSWDAWVVRLGAINRIRGSVFIDNNSNGTRDPGEPLYSRVQIKTEKPGYTRISSPLAGIFTNEVDTGNYITTCLPDYPYFTVSPAQRASSFNNYFLTDSFSFALAPTASRNDLQMGIIPITPARPGFQSTYMLFYENVGTTTLSGTVKFVKDSRTSLLSSAPAPISIVADTLTYQFSNLNPGDSSSARIVLGIPAPPGTNIGDTLKFTGLIQPLTGDETPLNNRDTVLQRVTGAYDPNDKTESHGAFISTNEVSSGEFLTYLVRFQNTGNDTAFNVIVRDTLDSRLQWDKMQVLTASHPYILEISGGRYLTWRFNNIKLVDSNRNEPASHGYIYFRIKPVSTVVAGDQIKNNVSIYFDFNLPVKTSDATTTVRTVIVTGINDPVPVNNWDLVAFPNPSNGPVDLAIRGKIYGDLKLSVIDAAGRQLLLRNIGRKSGPVLNIRENFNGWPAGIYYLTVTGDKESKTLTLQLK